MPHKFNVGQRVESSLRGAAGREHETGYHPGVVRYVNPNGSYAIIFDDGEELEAVAETDIMLSPYELLIAATVALQAFARGHSVRRERILERLREEKQRLGRAKELLRNRVRRFRAEWKLKELKFLKKMGPNARMYVRVIRAATKVQTLGFIIVARNKVRRRKRGIVVCQSVVRQHLQTRWFGDCKTRIVRVQSIARRYQAWRAFRFARACAISIQAAARRWLAQQRLIHRTESATVLEAFVRCHVQRQRYARCRRFVTLAQASVRGYAARARYRRQRKGVILLQAVVRGRSPRHYFEAVHHVATGLQQRVRERMAIRAAKRELQVLRLLRQEKTGASVVVQRWYRRRHAIRGAYRARCAALIQAQARGVSTRARLWNDSVEELRRQAERLYAAELARMAQEIDRQMRCAVRLQCWVRQWIARKRRGDRLHEQYQQHAAATKMASVYRMHVSRAKARWRVSRIIMVQSARRRVLGRYAAESRMRAILAIQAHYRRHHVLKGVQRLHHVATRIQSAHRMRTMLSVFRKLVRAAAVLQAFGRRVGERRRYLLTRKVVVCLQQRRRFKCWRAMARRLGATVRKAQALARGFLVRQALTKLHAAVMKIQPAARLFIAKRKLLFLKSQDSIVIIQACVRGFLRRGRLLKAIDLLRKIVTQAASRRSFNREYVILLEGARERHKLHRLLNSPAAGGNEMLPEDDGANDDVVLPATMSQARAHPPPAAGGDEGMETSFPSQLSEVSLRYLVEAKLFSHKLLAKSKYGRLVEAAVKIQCLFRGIVSRRRVLKRYSSLSRVWDTVRKLTSIEERKRRKGDVAPARQRTGSLLDNFVPALPKEDGATSTGAGAAPARMYSQEWFNSHFPATPRRTEDVDEPSLEGVPTWQLRFFTPRVQRPESARIKRQAPGCSPRRHLPSDFRMVDRPSLRDCRSVHTRLSTRSLHLIYETHRHEKVAAVLQSSPAALGKIVRLQAAIRGYLVRTAPSRADTFALPPSWRQIAHIKTEQEAMISTLLGEPVCVPPPPPPPEDDELPSQYDETSISEVLDAFDVRINRWSKQTKGIVRLQSRVRGVRVRQRMRADAAAAVREKAIAMFLHEKVRAQEGRQLAQNVRHVLVPDPFQEGPW